MLNLGAAGLGYPLTGYPGAIGASGYQGLGGIGAVGGYPQGYGGLQQPYGTTFGANGYGGRPFRSSNAETQQE